MKIEISELALSPGGRTPEDMKIVLPDSPYHDVRAVLADAARREGDPPRAAVLCAEAVREHWAAVNKRRNVLSPQPCDVVEMQKQCLRGVHRTVRQGINGPPAALAYGDFAVHGEMGIFMQAGDISLHAATREGVLADLSARHRDDQGNLLVHVGYSPEEPRFEQISFAVNEETVFLMATDGLPKALGEAALARLIRQAYQAGVVDTVANLRQRLVHEGFEDDVTLVMIKVTPAVPLRPRGRTAPRRHVWANLPWAGRRKEGTF